MRYGRHLVFLLVLLAASGTGAYGQDVKKEAVGPVAADTKQEVRQPAPEAPAAASLVQSAEKRFVATPGADSVQHVEIVGGEYYLDPNYVVVRVNTPVELKVKKTPGYVPHDFVINAPEAGIELKTALSDDWKTFTFTPTRAGKYEMFCDKKLLWFKSHKDRGMDGYIEVVP